MKYLDDKNAAYTVYTGDIHSLSEELLQLCGERYERCEFYRIAVERSRDGRTWKVHEFSNMEGDALDIIENHLSAGTDTVKFLLGADDYRLEFRVCPPGDSEHLARFLDGDEREELGEDDLVVLCVESGGVSREHREFLSGLERN